MSHKQLWAPWRMDYIAEHKVKNASECVFCTLPAQTDDRNNLIIHRAQKVFVIMNRYPYTNGHLMVVPNQHTNDYTTLPTDVSAELTEFTQHSVKALKAAYKAEGFNIGMNIGQAGGAGIRDHLHMHVVPRWLGDTNFMPVLADTKSMPQHLLTAYDQIQDYFRRL